MYPFENLRKCLEKWNKQTGWRTLFLKDSNSKFFFLRKPLPQRISKPSWGTAHSPSLDKEVGRRWDWDKVLVEIRSECLGLNPDWLYARYIF